MRHFIGAALTVLVVGLIIVGVEFFLHQTTYGAQPQLNARAAGTTPSPVSSLPHVSLTVETFAASPYTDPDALKTFEQLGEAKSSTGGPGASGPGRSATQFEFPSPANHPDWVTYWPTVQYTVPAHSLVTMTILNWDTQTPLLNPFYARVQGTVGGTETVDGKAVSSVDPATVSHTFTLRTIPDSNSPWLYVSVPDVGVSSNAPTDANGFPLHPVTNTFSFVTQGPGTYRWNCFDPCGTQFDGFGGPMQTYGYMSGTLVVK